MTRILPFGAAASMITGLAMAILWPRLTAALMWSLLGLTIALFGGVATMHYGRPDLLAEVPSDTVLQVGILVVMLAFGTIIQWTFVPVKRKRKKAKPPSSSSNDANGSAASTSPRVSATA